MDRDIFHRQVFAVINRVPGNQELVKLFFASGNKFQKYLIGKNDQSKEIIRSVNIDGIIDDFNTKESYWNNVPIISSKNLSEKSIVVNCSTSISPITVHNMLSELGVKNILSLHELIYGSAGLISAPWFVKQMIFDYKVNSERWYSIYKSMSDEESRRTLLDVLFYRLTADYSYMKNYSVRLHDQYFEDFMQYHNEVFVDIGGFDGDTTEEFCSRFPDYTKVLFFEPSEKNMAAAKNRLKELKNIEYFSLGLSNKEDILFFQSNGGSASSIHCSGETKIQVCTLDKIVKEPVSTIKMDIEGWELKALKGSKMQITLNKPKLAIAVYHNACDFWKLPEYILTLCGDYKIYIRQYSEGWSETIMYFIPKK